jgi:hypothetical protein
VIWDFVGEPIPPALRTDLEKLSPRLQTGPLADALSELLEPYEIRAVSLRLADLLADGRFPEPGPGRPYPWPIV